MDARHTHRNRFLAALVAAVSAALVAGPAAAARAKPPEGSTLAAAKRVDAKSLRRARAAVAGETVFLGYDSYAGLELWATRVGGRIVGMPYG